MSTMVSSVFRGSMIVHVVLHSRSFPTDAEWDEFVAERGELLDAVGSARLRGLVISDGGAPTARQRTMYRERSGRVTVPSAQVTSSRLALGIAVAMSWVNPSLKSFAPRDFARALRHIGVPEEEWRLLAVHLDGERVRLPCEALDAVNTQALRAAR
jgi:hypothetical protein